MTDMPTEDAWVITDKAAQVMSLSGAAARLLSVSHRGIYGRNLLLFLGGERAQWLDVINRLRAGDHVTRNAILRPKERRQILVSIAVTPAGDDWNPTAIRWVITAPSSSDPIEES
jgi:hypothetical protein